MQPPTPWSAPRSQCGVMAAQILYVPFPHGRQKLLPRARHRCAAPPLTQPAQGHASTLPPRCATPHSLLRRSRPPPSPTLAGNGSLQFSHPSAQQHLLVWRDKPRVAMVLKKLGPALTQHFLEVVTYLGEVERMLVVVEPAMYDACIQAGLSSKYVYSFTPQDRKR